MVEMPYQYGLSEGVVLRADPDRLAETLAAYMQGEWRPYAWIGKDWVERLPITEAQAEALTHGPVSGNSGPSPTPR